MLGCWFSRIGALAVASAALFLFTNSDVFGDGHRGGHGGGHGGFGGGQPAFAGGRGGLGGQTAFGGNGGGISGYHGGAHYGGYGRGSYGNHGFYGRYGGGFYGGGIYGYPFYGNGLGSYGPFSYGASYYPDYYSAGPDSVEPDYSFYYLPSGSESFDPAIALPPDAPEVRSLANDTSAAITVRVPVTDAEVFFDGTAMQQSGTTRAFVSPPLEPGARYQYQIRARWIDDGKPVSQTQAVTVRAGQRLSVDFVAAQSARGIR